LTERVKERDKAPPGLFEIIRRLEGIDKAPSSLLKERNVDTIAFVLIDSDGKENSVEFELPLFIRMHSPLQLISEARREGGNVLAKVYMLLFDLGLYASLHPGGTKAKPIYRIMGRKLEADLESKEIQKEFKPWHEPLARMPRYIIELWRRDNKIREASILYLTHVRAYDIEKIFKAVGFRRIVLSRSLGEDKGEVQLVFDPSMIDDLKRYRRVGAYICRRGYTIVFGSQNSIRRDNEIICPNTKCPLRSTCDDWWFVLGGGWVDAYYEDITFRPVIYHKVLLEKHNIIQITRDELAPIIVEGLKDVELRNAVIGARIELKEEGMSLPIFWTFNTAGYRYVDARGVSLAIDRTWLRKIVSALLLTDPKLFKITLIKYFIDGYNRSKSIFKERRGFYNLQSLTYLFLYLATNDKDIEERYPRFRELREWIERADDESFRENVILDKTEPTHMLDWAVELALHSLKHAFYIALVEGMLRADSDDIIMLCDQKEIEDRINDGRIRIVLLEDSEGGLGYMETLKELGAKRLKIIADLAEKALQQFVLPDGKDPCLVSWNTYRQRLEQALPQMIKISSKLRARLEDLNKRFTDLTGINIPVEVARHMIYIDRILKEEKNNLRKELQSHEQVNRVIEVAIANTIPYDWDGCLGCIRLEYVCPYSAYDQMFNLSKYMARSILEALVDPSSPITRTGEQAGLELEKLVEKAKKVIRIVSPWITPGEIRNLIEKARNGVKVFLVTKEYDHDVAIHNEAVSELLRIRSGVPLLRLILVKEDKAKKLHSKIYVIDDSIGAIGSLNYTQRGMRVNIESLALSKNKSFVYQLIGDYLEHIKIAD